MLNLVLQFGVLTISCDRIQENPRVEENLIQFIVINLGNYVEKRGLPAGVNWEVALYLKLQETVH